MRKWFAATVVVAVLFVALTPRLSAYAFGEGAKGPDVYAVQGMLKSLGYYAGSIDGAFGPMMKSGVKYFQQRHGLPVTGTVDSATLQSILWAYAELKIPKRTPTPAPNPPPAPGPGPGQQPTVPELSEDELRMIQLVNEARKQAGLSPLTADKELSQVARIKSAEMISEDYFSHTSPTYGSPFDMMKKFGIQYRSAGENIACNQTVDAAHRALMESPGHRENILGTQFTHIGVGIVKGGMCGQMFTQMFIGK